MRVHHTAKAASEEKPSPRREITNTPKRTGYSQRFKIMIWPLSRRIRLTMQQQKCLDMMGADGSPVVHGTDAFRACTKAVLNIKCGSIQLKSFRDQMERCIFATSIARRQNSAPRDPLRHVLEVGNAADSLLREAGCAPRQQTAIFPTCTRTSHIILPVAQSCSSLDHATLIMRWKIVKPICVHGVLASYNCYFGEEANLLPRMR